MHSTIAAPAKSSSSQFFGYTGWFLAALLFFYGWVLRVSPSVMVEQLMREFSVSGAILGNLSAVYFYAYAALQMPVGLAHDRWGPRRVLSLSALVAGCGTLVFALAPNVEIAYVGRAMIGTGSAFALVGSMILATTWFSPKHFALLTGSALSLGLLGGIGGQAPLAYLVQFQGWRTAMLILAGGAFVISLLIWLLTRDQRHPRPTPAPSAPNDKPPVLRALWQVAKQRQTILIALFAGLTSSPALAFGALWGVPYTMQAYDVSRPGAAFAVSSILFGWVLGGPFWGWFSDRIGRRKWPIIISSIITSLSMTAVLYLPGLSFDMYRLLLFINGIGAAAMPISYALVREHNPGGSTGAALGFVNMLAVAGGAIFQPIVGFLLDSRWSGKLVEGARFYSPENYSYAFMLLPALYVSSLLTALFIRETFCRPVKA